MYSVLEAIIYILMVLPGTRRWPLVPVAVIKVVFQT